MAVEQPVVISLVSGEIVATGVSWEEYMERYAAHFCEWVDGTVVKMSPVHDAHDMIMRYLAMLFEAYFAYKPIGRIRQAPFVMRLERTREPDIQIILHINPHELKPTYMDGPADICIEVVSPESVSRDYGEKFAEYEKGGVREYWTIDPERQDSRFYRLSENGLYEAQRPNDADNYRTPNLPGLVIHVPTFWQQPLPDFLAVGRMMQEMVGAG